MVDFLGIENKTIDTLSAAFPKSRIISRGNQILIKGPTGEIGQIDDVLTSLVDHYHKYGRITEENVQAYIEREHEVVQAEHHVHGGALAHQIFGVVYRLLAQLQAKAWHLRDAPGD